MSCKKIVLSIAALFLVSAPALGGQRQFPLSAGQTLEFDLSTGGSVSITGWDRAEALIEFEGPQEAIRFEPTAEGLRVKTEDSAGWSVSSSIRLEVMAPRRTNVRFDSRGGGLTLKGLEGVFEGETMGGGLTLEQVSGEARLTTMGGRILLRDSDLDGRLATMGGEVLFENVVGDVEGSSMGGNVQYRNVRRRDGGQAAPGRKNPLPEAAPETIQISTMGGAIDIEEGPEGVDLHTMGGDIEVGSADRFARVKTMGGDIELKSVRGWVEATTMSGDVQVRLEDAGGADQHVQLESYHGDVTLIVPPGFSMQVDLQLSYTRNSRRDFQILTDFPVDQQESEEWNYERGTPRKTIQAVGSIGGGRHRVQIRTINGNIRVQQGG